MSADNNSSRLKYLKRFSNKSFFLQGDEAVAYGAVYAGCNFFGGYPITPASEIAETMAAILPLVDAYYIQMEDEIASLAAVIGAVWAGAKATTATSGPGFSLMQEGIGYAVMTETPCVIIDVQRSGPSTGQATKPAQGDVMQARWGTHGDHEIIALAPSSVQECFDLIIDAFNLAEEYRNPVIFLMDGEIGHCREVVRMPDPEKMEIKKRRLGGRNQLPFGGQLIPPMMEFGGGYDVHVTGSTHKADGMRDVSTQEVHHELISRVYAKIDKNRHKIVRAEQKLLDDAEIAVLAYGAAARPAEGAVLQARAKGKKVGLMRLITLWPFPRDEVRALGRKVRKIFVPEMNLGQIVREIERFVSCPVIPITKIGGVPHTIGEIFSKII